MLLVLTMVAATPSGGSGDKDRCLPQAEATACQVGTCTWHYRIVSDNKWTGHHDDDSTMCYRSRESAEAAMGNSNAAWALCHSLGGCWDGNTAYQAMDVHCDACGGPASAANCMARWGYSEWRDQVDAIRRVPPPLMSPGGAARLAKDWATAEGKMAKLEASVTCFQDGKLDRASSDIDEVRANIEDQRVITYGDLRAGGDDLEPLFGLDDGVWHAPIVDDGQRPVPSTVTYTARTASDGTLHVVWMNRGERPATIRQAASMRPTEDVTVPAHGTALVILPPFTFRSPLSASHASSSNPDVGSWGAYSIHASAPCTGAVPPGATGACPDPAWLTAPGHSVVMDRLRAKLQTPPSTTEPSRAAQAAAWHRLNTALQLPTLPSTGAEHSQACGTNSTATEDGTCGCDQGYHWADAEDPNNLDCVRTSCGRPQTLCGNWTATATDGSHTSGGECEPDCWEHCHLSADWKSCLPD